MKTQHFLFIGVLAVVGMIMFYAFSGAQIDEGYVKDIIAFRKDKDKRFLNSEDSPLDQAGRSVFDSLSYFPPNPVYRVTANLEWAEQPEIMELPTTKDGQVQEYLRIARANFKLAGEEHSVQFLKAADRPEDPNMYLFFKDATSGGSTYGAGRYVDVVAKKTSTCIIDFNMAYNPYCAYNDYYICPIPPAGNKLSIPIEAGEKYYYPKSKEEDKVDEN